MSSTRAGPLELFAVSLAGTLALGTFFAVLLLVMRATSGSWGAAVAPFAAGLIYIVGLALLALVERRLVAPSAAVPWLFAALPICGALAGLTWAAVDPAQAWVRDAVIGFILAALHGWLGYRSWRRQGPKAPASAP